MQPVDNIQRTSDGSDTPVQLVTVNEGRDGKYVINSDFLKGRGIFPHLMLGNSPSLAIFGSHAVGKSTILNELFSVDFKVLEVADAETVADVDVEDDSVINTGTDAAEVEGHGNTTEGPPFVCKSPPLKAIGIWIVSKQNLHIFDVQGVAAPGDDSEFGCFSAAFLLQSVNILLIALTPENVLLDASANPALQTVKGMFLTLNSRLGDNGGAQKVTHFVTMARERKLEIIFVITKAHSKSLWGVKKPFLLNSQKSRQEAAKWALGALRPQLEKIYVEALPSSVVSVHPFNNVVGSVRAFVLPDKASPILRAAGLEELRKGIQSRISDVVQAHLRWEHPFLGVRGIKKNLAKARQVQRARIWTMAEGSVLLELEKQLQILTVERTAEFAVAIRNVQDTAAGTELADRQLELWKADARKAAKNLELPSLTSGAASKFDFHLQRLIGSGEFDLSQSFAQALHTISTQPSVPVAKIADELRKSDEWTIWVLWRKVSVFLSAPAVRALVADISARVFGSNAQIVERLLNALTFPSSEEQDAE